MRFLGTGAGEGIPNPFCGCEFCENARKCGGKEIRMRSSFRVDEKLIIDIGADFFAQAARFGERFDTVEHVLYTHTHTDHFNFNMIWERSVRTSGKLPPLNVYFTEEAMDVIDEFFMNSRVTYGREAYTRPEDINFVRLKFGETKNICGYNVTPLRGEHSTSFEQNAANYLLEKNGKSLYYALDSGYFLDETFERLSGKRLDIFIGECTFPVIGKDFKPDLTGHMDINMCLKNLEKLYEINAVTESTKVYLTHIGPLATHEQLCRYFEELKTPYKITAAYDGMII